MAQETDDIFALAVAVEEATKVFEEGIDTAVEGLESIQRDQDLSSASSQALMHDVQWKLVCFAEKCYWASSTKRNQPLPQVRDL